MTSDPGREPVPGQEWKIVPNLTTLDAGFLQLEDADHNISLAIGGLAVIDGPAPEFGELSATVGQRCLTNPRSTQILQTHPLDLTAPNWVDDPSFELSHHIRRTGLPQPGDDAALHATIATIMERRLDRARPLWECWVIEGLADERWALLLKVHHALADGISAAHLLTGICDEHDVESFASSIAAAQHTSDRLNPPKPGLNPIAWLSDSARFSLNVGKSALRAAAGAAEIVADLLRPGPESPLNGPLGDLRRYSSAVVPLEEVEQICRSFDVTINDVALSAVADSYRSGLLRRGQQPRADSLRTLVPVSVRPPGAMDAAGNRVSLMLPYLPVDVADPLQRLRVVHERLQTAKGSGQRQAGSIVVRATNLLPFALTAWTVRLLARLPQRSIVTVVTNVPGPRQRVTLMGRQVVRLLPIPPIAADFRTGIAIFSYADEISFGLLVDFDAAPDVDELAAGVRSGVDRLAALARSLQPAEH